MIFWGDLTDNSAKKEALFLLWFVNVVRSLGRNADRKYVVPELAVNDVSEAVDTTSSGKYA